MRFVSTALLGLIAAITPLSCAQNAERGRMETLNPILGRGPLGGAVPRTAPSEPVEDYSADLGPLAVAWPRVTMELPHLIRAAVARSSWTDEHHVAIVQDMVLRVRHRPEVVTAVRELVESMRQRLLHPLQIQLALVEVKASAAAGIFPRSGAETSLTWNVAAHQAAEKRGEARTLARVVLNGHNGEWVGVERLKNQTFLSGVQLADGVVTPRTTELASGFTVQAAAWRWGRERAVVAAAGLYTGEAQGGQKVSQEVNRALPTEKSYERKWEPHQINLELPVRELVEVQAQVTVSRGQWTVTSIMPRDGDRLTAVAVRADWSTPVAEISRVKTFSDRDFALEIIPIALPTDTRARVPLDDKLAISNGRNIEERAGVWLKDRARKHQESQKRSTYNFQDETIGGVDLSLSSQRASYVSQSKMSQEFQSRGGSGNVTGGALPAELEQLQLEVMQADWPAGTALEFVANHVFVVHTAAITAKLRRLLDGIHAWRNRRMLVSVAFPLLGPQQLNRLDGGPLLPAARAERLRRATGLLPEARVVTRPGAWTDLFVGEMHAVLNGAWAPGQSSPPVFVYWRGARLAVAPYLESTDEVAYLELNWKQHRLDGLEPRQVARALLQQPADEVWSHDQLLRLPSKTAALVGLQGRGLVPALLVTAAGR